MRLTERGWRLSLAAIASLVVLLALQVIGGSSDEERSLLIEGHDYYSRLRSIDNAEHREAVLYLGERLTVIMDSLAHLVPSRPSAPDRSSDGVRASGVTTIALDTVGRASRTLIESTIAQELSDIPELRVPIRVLVMQSLRDRFARLATYEEGRAPLARYVLLPSRPGEPCTVLLTARLADLSVLGAALSTVDGLLGPCAYFAAFGLPGRPLRAHLDSAAWYPAAFTRWRDSLDVGEPRREPWSNLTSEGVHCMLRADDICAREWVADAPRSRYERPSADLSLVAEGEPVLARALPWYNTRGIAFGVRQRLWLSDLVREVGERRFGEFWRSETPVDSAFLHLVGMHENAWTAQWLARRYAPYTPSPRPSRAELGWWALVMFASLATLARVRKRRAR